MRTNTTVLDELWLLIDQTEFGKRAAPGGRERWAINCARRAVSANSEFLGPEMAVLRDALARAGRWVKAPPTDDALTDADATLVRAQSDLRQRIHAATRQKRILELERGHRAVQAVQESLACVAHSRGHEQVAALARSAFQRPEQEAAAQARRLLLCTKLLPTGADLLVRLDYVEALGRMPEDPSEREWIEAQRALLMTEDEQARMLMILRHLELVFLPELDRVR